MSLGTPEIMFVVVLVLLLFGPDRLPGLLKSVGRGMREIKRVTSDFQNHFDFDDDAPPRSVARPAANNAPQAAPHNAHQSNETIPPPSQPSQQTQFPLDQIHHAPIENAPTENAASHDQAENEKKREA